MRSLLFTFADLSATKLYWQVLSADKSSRLDARQAFDLFNTKLYARRLFPRRLSADIFVDRPIQNVGRQIGTRKIFVGRLKNVDRQSADMNWPTEKSATIFWLVGPIWRPRIGQCGKSAIGTYLEHGSSFHWSHRDVLRGMSFAWLLFNQPIYRNIGIEIFVTAGLRLFLQATFPSQLPTNSAKALKVNII